jgi:hypothetical protein
MNYFKCLSFAVVFVLFTVSLAEAKAIRDSAETERSYYVAAAGNDTNDGLSEMSAFRTLGKAVELASAGEIKHITVIGVLDNDTENSGAETNVWETDSVFEIVDSGEALITIAGKPGTEATLRGGDGKRVIIIYGDSNIRFESILITGGDTDEEGGGIFAGDGASIILGKGAVLSGNLADEGGGIYLEDGYLTLLQDAAIIDNAVFTDEGGGAVIVEGVFFMADNSRISGNSGGGLLLIQSEGTMEGFAEISDNNCEYNGGGVFAYQSDFTMRGNSQISGNKAGKDGGGIWVREGGLVVSERAWISVNYAGVDGGGINLEDSSLVLCGYAEVSGNISEDDGGGIHSEGGSVILDENAILADNEALCGGGLCIENHASAIIRGGSVKIKENRAIGSSQGGGGICAGYSSVIHMTGGEVVNNTAILGGGAFFEGANFIIDGGYIAHNKAESGGGIYARAGSYLKISDEAILKNNYPNDMEEK